MTNQQTKPPETPALGVFRISPLIRLTLLSLYIALTLPLPFLAEMADAPLSPAFLWVGLAIGLGLLYGALSERVIVDDTGISVRYPAWFPLRKGWFLPWQDVQALKPKTTGQGGLVYYFLSKEGKGYLLPMRMVGFAKFVQLVQQKTNLDTRDVRPLAQPWMYIILLSFTFLLLLVDAWTISTAIAMSH
ncbi:hypothetical protein NG798_09170 [Ancylothrix sp. C2]|uniref:hypothetical protein n=1 Tax=Ancylothrix sp. D3o TaxID=2953691 RepID=UPI0021BA56C3|nr:hypothetical protein [Ancylothrix sp. D3o]MCT7949955.1 hypothetical protein [Ancylothrix sp. D3o]